MFAVIKTGGKQHKVAVADQVTVMALDGAAGDHVTFEHVLGLVDGEKVEIGAPYLSGVTVIGEIVRQARGPKVIAFKKRRRKNSRRKRGHRQDLTMVKIVEILTGGAKPKVEAKAATPAKAPEAAPAGDHGALASAAHEKAAAARAAGHDTTKFVKLEKAIGGADDLELIGGVGPTIAKKLHGVGIFHFWQVVAMSEEDISAVEHEVGFVGRAKRDHWKDQAQELMDGKGPRAKVDQERAKHETK